MRNKLILLSSSLLFCLFANSQNFFTLTILADSNIKKEKIYCIYNTGKYSKEARDEFINNRLSINDSLFADYGTIHIEYRSDDSTYQSNDFFINKKPSTITLRFNNENNNTLAFKEIINAIPIYDSSNNSFWRDFIQFRKQETDEVSLFFEKYGGNPDSQDSLKQHVLKTLNNRSIAFFKRNSNNYMSFWYFKDQVVIPSLIYLKSDYGYLQNLQMTMQSIFPKKFVASPEGEAITRRLIERNTTLGIDSR